MIAEREESHARVFESRMRDLCAERRARATEENKQLKTFLSDPDRSDLEKMNEFVRLTGDPAAVIGSIEDFAAQLVEDLESKEALRLFTEAEYSTLKWARDMCSTNKLK